jgi:hypothetical protein
LEHPAPIENVRIRLRNAKGRITLLVEGQFEQKDSEVILPRVEAYQAIRFTHEH